MIKLHVLGAGCTRCKVLAKNTDAAAKALNLEYELVKVTDITEIITYNVMTTPAVMVNGKTVVAGDVPSIAQLQELIQGAL